MANAFECRSTPSSLFTIGPFSNRLLVGAVAIELLILGAFVYSPALQHLLDHRGLSPAQAALIAVTPLVLIGAEELRKALFRRALRTAVP